MTSAPGPRVLLVGAGAVGQVYGWYAAQGGARVSFLVKPRHVAGLQGGVSLYPLNRSEPRRTPVRWSGYELVTSVQAEAVTAANIVILCTASPALREPWLPELVAALPPTCTVVCLAAGMDDVALVRSIAGEARVVAGLIALISYAGPIEGEQLPEPGMVWWFPPGVRCPFAGPTAHVAAVVGVLHNGGMPVAHREAMLRQSGWPNAFLMPFLVALESRGWSFDRMRSERGMQDAAFAISETMTVVAKRLQTSRPLWSRLLHPWVLDLVLRAAERVIPLPLEAYLQVHFTKVGEQTRMFVADYLTWSQRLGCDAVTLRRLSNSLQHLPP